MSIKLQTKISKTLSFILRHNINKNGCFKCDEYGFVRLSEILEYMKNNNIKCNIDDIIYIVNTNDKQRFALECKYGEYFIKANQGHSLSVGEKINDDLSYEIITEPLLSCIHGTETKFLKSICDNGLNRMKRKHIHFVEEIDRTKQISGFKQKSDVAIYIDMQKCMNDGMVFYKSANGVILSEGFNGVIEPKYFQQIV